MKSLRLLILAALLFWFSWPSGHAPAPTPPFAPERFPTLIDRCQVTEDIRKLLFPGMSLDIWNGPEDGNYCELTVEETKELMKFWQHFKQPLSYIEDAWDCDDFAREFYTLARAWAANEWGYSAAPLVAIVLVHVDGVYPLFGDPNREEETFNHALNAFRIKGHWFFFEPQSGLAIRIEPLIYEGVIEVHKVSI